MLLLQDFNRNDLVEIPDRFLCNYPDSFEAIKVFRVLGYKHPTVYPRILNCISAEASEDSNDIFEIRDEHLIKCS